MMCWMQWTKIEKHFSSSTFSRAENIQDTRNVTQKNVESQFKWKTGPRTVETAHGLLHRLQLLPNRTTSTDPEVNQSTEGNIFSSLENPFLEKSEWGWTINPTGFRIMANQLYDRHQKPLFFFENELGVAETPDASEHVEDDYRIDCIEKGTKHSSA